MFNHVLLKDHLMWNFPLMVSLIGIAVIYSFLVLRFTKQKVYHKQPLFFLFGLGLLFLTIGSPLTTISHLSFSLHMLQMSILYFVIPPILYIGIHNSLFQRISKVSMVIGKGKWFLSPRNALIVFAILFLVYHLPVVLTVLSKNSLVHIGYLLLQFILSFRMWLPIVSPDPSLRFCKEQQKRYAVLSGILLLPACLIFIFGALVNGFNNPFLTQITAYLCIPSSISFNILPPPFNTKYDQLFAGFIMLGIHKISLITTFRLKREALDIQEENVSY